ncbi:MAG: DUF4350 domain-containing protein [Acidimicrobiales bacterium]
MTGAAASPTVASTSPRLGRSGRAAVVSLLLLGALVAAGAALSGGPGGPAFSSYTTAPDGLAAYAQLLGQSGHHIVQMTSPAPARQPALPATLVIAAPTGMSTGAEKAAARFALDGGRLVLAGAATRPIIELLLGHRSPTWSPRPVVRATGRLAGAPGSPRASVLTTGAGGSWSSSGGTMVVLSGRHGALVTEARAGKGTVIMVSDPSLLQNGQLAQAGNAAVGLALAGPASAPVIFDENVHGFSPAGSGLGAVPGRWRLSLALVAASALAYLLSRARRLGPPEPSDPAPAPPRARHVEALAGLLVRTSEPAAVAEPLRQEALALLYRYVGLGGNPAAASTELLEALKRRPVPEDVVRAVLAPERGEAGAIMAARALAWLGSSR